MKKAIDKTTMFTYTVGDLLNKLERGKIIIDNTFQRKYVWSKRNQINLIESIILGYPIPEFIFLERIDKKNSEFVHVVIDGQQRIGALTDFVNGEFSLSTNHLNDEMVKKIAGGKKYEELDYELQYSFLDYPLYVRLISSEFSTKEVQTIFMRLNSNSLALNPQELRNAVYNGEFLKLAEEIADMSYWDRYRLFSNSERRRMQDIQFVSSVLLFLRLGIGEETTSENLNKVYDTFEESYDEKEEDRESFISMLNIIEPILSDDNNLKFLRRKSQLYILLIVAYKFYMNNQYFGENEVSNFTEFVRIYNLNEEQMKTFIASQKINDIIEYKNLSKSGTQKKMNRIKRIRLLEKLIMNNY